MPSLGRRYVHQLNNRCQRAGISREGHNNSSLVDRETWLLHCYRSIELNPLRVGMTTNSLNDTWSRRAHHALDRDDPLIHSRSGYLAPGSAEDERHQIYCALAM